MTAEICKIKGEDVGKCDIKAVVVIKIMVENTSVVLKVAKLFNDKKQQ